MHSIISVNPFRCRVWAMHDRLDAHITEDTCRVEIESFSKYGQLIPVLGRSLRGDPAYDVELIYGARRLFAARHINMPLQVELRELCDQEAIIALDIENRQRQDLSAYERGISYALWLREGHFKSQDDIARALKISASKVSRLLKVARLPSVIVNAFHRPLDIREEWALELVDAMDDPRRRNLTVQRARAIGGLQARPAALEICRHLLAVKDGRRRIMEHDEVVKDRNGIPLFRIRRQSNTLAFLLPSDQMADKTLTEVTSALSLILDGRNRAVGELPTLEPVIASVGSWKQHKNTESAPPSCG